MKSLPLLCLAALMAIGGPSPVRAQNFSVGEASKPSVTLVESDYVREQALLSFELTTARRLKEAQDTLTDTDAAAQSASRLEELVREIRLEFAQELNELLQELEGDGVLEVSEASDDIGALREDLLRQMQVSMEAVQEGHAPPPLPRQFDSDWQYTERVVGYTLLERNTPAEWGRFALYIVGGLLLAWLASRALGFLTRVLQRHGWRGSAHLAESLRGPLYLVAAAWGLYLGLNTVWIPGVAESALDKVVKVVFTLALFWFLWGAARAVASAITWILGKTYNKHFDHHIEVFIFRVLRVVVLISFVVVLINVVLSSDLTGLLAGLGVIGVALSFILRGSIENLAGSFTLFGDQPIRVGDLMIYKEQWGHVEDIGFRAVRFRTFDGHLINIPNGQMINEAIHNVGARPFIRRRFRISLTYDTSPEKVREAIGIVEDILHNHEGQPEDQPPHVLFEAYGAYDLRIMVQYCVEPPDYWSALEFDSKVNLQILERFKDAGLEFAFPTSTNVLKTDPDEPPQLIWQDDREEANDESPDEDESEPSRTPGKSSGNLRKRSAESSSKDRSEYREDRNSQAEDAD